MRTRKPCLPPGWYPRSAAEIARFLAPFSQDEGRPRTGKAAVAPHAGWYYSGSIAAAAVSALDPDIDTVVVIGGHLPAGMPPLFALEDEVETPLGGMVLDAALRDSLIKTLGGAEDRYQDNTVEVLLPMVRYFFPKAALLWVRLPAELSSFEAGRLIAAAASALGRRIAVLGSTDLTHYGPNYGFSPRGRGEAALRWVRDCNDRRFIDAVLSGDSAAVLRRACEESSACSAGAVLGAMGFTAASGGTAGSLSAELLAYGTSADIASNGVQEDEPPPSFVGYAAIAFL